MSFKDTTHSFESGSDVIEVTEFPFYPGEKTNLTFKPYKGRVEDIGIVGNPTGEQTLYFTTDDSRVWIKGNCDFVDALEEKIKKWKKGWEDYNTSVETKIGEDNE